MIDEVWRQLRDRQRLWLVTGAAGFIGSHLVEALLGLGQRVVGLDNLSTGRQANLEQVRLAVGEASWRGFRFVRGDIRSIDTCREACRKADFVLHEAALCSVPASIVDPVACHASNLTGFVNVLMAAHSTGVERVVYAGSSAAYGDSPLLPQREAEVGQALSPYGLTKHLSEAYAGLFARCYGLPSIGLRYFNVFGPRQDPQGAYAAVIPKWIDAMIRNEAVFINGDGETTRDFCHVDNVVQANLLAALVADPAAVDQVYNVALGGGTTLNELFEAIRARLAQDDPGLRRLRPVHREFAPGDVRRSVADIGKARRLLGYQPRCQVAEGLARTIDWYLEQAAPRKRGARRGAESPAAARAH